MAFQPIFQRYELKYLLSREQRAAVEAVLPEHMKPDRYGPSVIRNLYFDTGDYRLIRRSMEKPVYKEKLRIRSYASASAEDTVFVELKKKYKGIVYKRRLMLPQDTAIKWLCGCSSLMPDSQIGREIQYFCSFYGNLHPTVFLSYSRQAWSDGRDLRITFDDNIVCRQDDLHLSAEPCGSPLLPEGLTLMEIKTSGGIPLWLTRILTRQQIFKTSFSKYGTAYAQMIFPEIKEERFHV